ncbi:MAG: PEP-CTERM sorting domain-containing protein [Verrucomicrobiales bacterium]|nr:PEP-CTERM sorting domain-containing protein [Verrucomicrobiales bacterium]
MQPQHYSRILRSVSLLPFAAAMSLHADVLVGGGATIDFHKSAWDSLAGGASVPGFEALTLDETFDQAGAASRTGAQILSDEVVASPSYVGLSYAMNGPQVVNLAGRTAQPTDFQFTPGDLAAHTGSIGLGGISRWAVNPLLGGGKLAFGDFTLRYDADRIALGGSGWHLVGNIAPSATIFDLVNVTTSTSGNTVTLAGDLAMSYEIANFLLATPSDQGKDMGDFRFSATSSVPEPSTWALLLLGGIGLCIHRAVGRNRRV